MNLYLFSPLHAEIPVLISENRNTDVRSCIIVTAYMVADYIYCSNKIGKKKSSHELHVTDHKTALVF